MHENSQTEGVGNEVRQRASKDLANNLNLAMVTIYTFHVDSPDRLVPSSTCDDSLGVEQDAVYSWDDAS